MAARSRLHIAVFLAPAVIVYTAVMIFPFSTPCVLLFTQGGEDGRVFAGLDNFRTLFGDPRWSDSFWNALGNNFWFFIIHMLVQNPIGIALAAILSHPRLRFAAFYRSAFFIPTILSFVIVGFAWKLILSPIWGIAPNMLDAVGLKSLFAPWLGKQEYALTTLALISVWQFVGIPMMLIYAALLSIPEEVLEAGEIDGLTGLVGVLEDQAAPDPAVRRHHLDPDIRGQLQCLRPDLFGTGRAGGAGLFDRHPRHLPLSHLLRVPAAARRPLYGLGHRHGDVRHHPDRRLHLPLGHPDPDAEVSVLMNRARSNPLNTALAHGALIAWTVIALFPVFVIIINSLKTRRAIFAEPLAIPLPGNFSLIGYQTVMKQGDFVQYFQNSMIVTVVSLFFILLFGAMAAFALSEYRFKGNTLMGLYLALGIMIPIRIGTVAILQLMVASGLINTLFALILVYTAQGLPLAVFILSEFMRQVSDDLKNAGTHRRVVGIHDLLQAGPAAGPPGDGDGRGVQHDPDLERPVVPADPGTGGKHQDADAGKPGVHRAVRD